LATPCWPPSTVGRAPAALLIGHLDTVFDPGTATLRPFRLEDGIAYGPGVTDMKSGLLAGLYALKALIGERGGLPFERLVLVANPDEEIGSPSSTPHIRAIASEVDVALVLECARANGDLVSARKGIPTAVSTSTAGPRTRVSNRRRAEAPSWRPPGSSPTCTSSTAAGRG
jgi:acetylornithine deacetylase/succinyl-diaminopimelate desuccinylase-like protein